jgi:hypothetical protein
MENQRVPQPMPLCFTWAPPLRNRRFASQTSVPGKSPVPRKGPRSMPPDPVGACISENARASGNSYIRRHRRVSASKRQTKPFTARWGSLMISLRHCQTSVMAIPGKSRFRAKVPAPCRQIRPVPAFRKTRVQAATRTFTDIGGSRRSQLGEIAESLVFSNLPPQTMTAMTEELAASRCFFRVRELAAAHVVIISGDAQRKLSQRARACREFRQRHPHDRDQTGDPHQQNRKPNNRQRCRTSCRSPPACGT